jgi:hypothetical protein
VRARYNPVDLALFARALPLASRAQRVQVRSFREVVASMSAPRPWIRRLPLNRLVDAAARANAHWCSWFGGIDSCLTRSLVIGAMLAGRDDVVLNIGFAPGAGDSPLEGHAWVTHRGEALGQDGRFAGDRFSRVLAVPFADHGSGP